MKDIAQLPPAQTRLDDGEGFTLNAGAPWRIVTGGYIDVFMQVEDENGTDIGRRLIFTAEPGHLLAGASAPDCRLLAIPRDGAVLSAPLPEPVDPQLLEGWLDGLLRGLSALESWKSDTPLRLHPGEQAMVAGGRRVRAAEGIVWIRQESGPPLRLGTAAPDEEILRQGFPVSRKTGLTSLGETRISAFSPDDLAGAEIRRLAEGAGSAIMTIRARMVIDAERELSERARHRTAAAYDKFTAAVASFGAVLGGHYSGVQTASLQPLEKAIAIIARSFDLKLPPHSVVREGDLSANAVERSARSMRLRPCRVRLADRWWKQDGGHLLAFMGDKPKPVILWRERSGYQIVDPQSGARRRLNKADIAAIGRSAYALYPVLEDKPLTIRKFLTFALNLNTRDSLEAFALVLLAGVLTMATPILSAYIINTVVPAGDTRLLAELAAALLIALIALGAVRYASEIAYLRIEGRTGNLARAALIDRIIRMPAHRIEAASTSSAAMQVDRLEGFRRSMIRLASSAVTALLFSLFSIGVLFYFADIAALIVLALMLALIAIISWIGYRQYRALYEGERIESNVNTTLYETIGNIAVLRAFGVEMPAFAHWAESFIAFRHRIMNSRRISNRATVLIAAYDLAVTTVAFAVIGLLHADTVSTGGFLAFVGALGVVTSSGLQMAQAVMGVFHALPAARVARPLLETAPLPLPRPGPEQAPSGSIEVSQIRHRYYPEGPLVLDGVSLRIEPQEYVAIVGPSGSGKSTLMRIMLGLETPEGGTVYYDGQDIARHDQTALRRHIGTVMQEAGLFPGSILDNIRGGADADIARIWEAAEAAAIADEIRAMPMGLHTMITGPDGAISGGQAQRILIARALAGNPSILFFDEGTSALDRIRQQQVETTLAALAVTRVVIAHRLDTVRRCDRIYVLDRGRIVQQGNFAELAAMPGLFADLLHAQRSDL